MTIITRDVEVEVVEGGVTTPLTREMLAADVLASAGGVAAVRGAGVPAGGATGKILAKRSGADYDLEWADPAPGGRTVGYVRHELVGSTLRPTGYAVVVWVGSAIPTNAAQGDLWVSP